MTLGEITSIIWTMSRRLHRSFFTWILAHAYEFKWHYLGAFICLFVLQNFQGLLPQKIRELTDSMTLQGKDAPALWIFVVLSLGIFVFRTLSRLLFFYPARVQQKFIRMELMELLESVPSLRYRNKSQGQIFQVLFDDVNNLRAFVGFGFLQIFNLIISAWVLIPKINQNDSYLWPAFIPLLSSVFIYTVVTFLNQKFFKKIADKKGEVQQFLIESYEAKQTVKNYHQEENFISHFLQLSKEEMSLFFKASIGFAFSGPYLKLALGLSLIWAAFLIRQVGGTPSDLVFFSGFLYLFLEPIQFLSWVAVVVAQGSAAWRRVKELHTDLSTPAMEEKSLKEAIFINQTQLHFQCPWWDSSLDVKFLKNKWTCIVGETGCGKSTLLISLANSLRFANQKVSFVPQNPYLFNDSIFNNIFLDRTPTSAQVNQAKHLIEIFQLVSLAPSLDEVLALEVGENGKRLSGGQLKRLALIRSLLTESDFILWDDPFSSLDIINEKKIMHALRRECIDHPKTFIITTHRLTTVKLMDEIIFLDRNKGLKVLGSIEEFLKGSELESFFKEQMVELSLD